MIVVVIITAVIRCCCSGANDAYLLRVSRSTLRVPRGRTDDMLALANDVTRPIRSTYDRGYDRRRTAFQRPHKR